MKLQQTFHRILGTTLLAACLLASPASAKESAADKTWTELPRPEVGKGLMMEPRLLGFGSRIHLIWTGTSPVVPKPELFHTSISGGSTSWTNPRAPFFGLNKSRVRKVSIGRTRNLIGVLFQRTLTQGNDAYEVLLSISSDQGWEWSKPMEIDSYVAEKTGGTWVSVDGREARARVEFTMAWVRDFGNLRVSNMDIKSERRPESMVVGQHVDGAMKAEVGSLGKDGFSVVFNNGIGLAAAHAKALIGSVSEGVTFLRGRYGASFAVASRPYGPSRLAVGDGNQIQAMTSDETAWKNDDQVGALPFSASGTSMEADMDDDQDLHVALLVPDAAGDQLWYIGQTDKVWGTAELVATMDPDQEMHGFDIGVTDDYVFLAESQGFIAKYFRRKHK